MGRSPATGGERAAAQAAARLDKAWEAAWSDQEFLTSQEALDRVVVLPTPSLALDWIFGCNGLTLARIHHLIGESGHRKTSLALEFLRWCFRLSGRGIYIETEGKDQPHLRQMIFRNDPAATRRVAGRAPYCAVFEADSINQWNATLTGMWDDLRKHFGSPLIGAAKKKGGPGAAPAPAAEAKAKAKAKKAPAWSVPIGLVVDSVVGATPDEVLVQRHKDGYAQQRISPSAGQISRDAPTWPRYLRETAMFLVLVNHNKPGADKFGNPVPHYAGGRALKFFATQELHVIRAGAYTARGRRGFVYRVVPLKSSFAPDDGRSLVVPNYAWRQHTKQGPRDEARFAWHEATVRLFGELHAKEKFRPLYKLLADVADVRVLSDDRCSCPKLGITDRAAVTFEELGRRIDGDAALRMQLQEIMGLQQFRIVDPAVVLPRLPACSAESYQRGLDRLLAADDIPGVTGEALEGPAPAAADAPDDDIDETPAVPAEEGGDG